MRFRLDAGDNQVGEWQVAVRAEYVRDVWVATRRLVARRRRPPRPTSISAASTSSPSASRPSPRACPLDGYEVAQSVAAGQPLTDRDLAPRTLVNRGQVVNVVAADGLFSISMKALATQDGANGAMIKVRNLTSQRDITAQVVGEARSRSASNLSPASTTFFIP